MCLAYYSVIWDSDIPHHYLTQIGEESCAVMSEESVGYENIALSSRLPSKLSAYSSNDVNSYWVPPPQEVFTGRDEKCMP